MKTKTVRLGLLLIALSIVLALPVNADVLELAPTEAVVLPSDGTGVTKVAFHFDITGMRQGDHRRVFDALLEWPIAGVPSSERSEYGVVEATSSWQASEPIPTMAEVATSTWEIAPEDYERVAGFVRLDVLGPVSKWANGTATNYGLVFTTPDVSGSTLSSQLSNARLIVRYSFMPD